MGIEHYKVIFDIDDELAGEAQIDLVFDGNICVHSHIEADSAELQQILRDFDLEEGVVFAMIEGSSRHEKWLLVEYTDSEGLDKHWTHKDHHQLTSDGKHDEAHTFNVLHKLEWTAQSLDLSPTSRSSLR